MVEIIAAVVGVLLTLWGGSLEMRLKSIKDKTTRDEVLELIDLKQEAIKAIQQEIKENTLEIKANIDRIERYLLDNKK